MTANIAEKDRNYVWGESIVDTDNLEVEGRSGRAENGQRQVGDTADFTATAFSLSPSAIAPVEHLDDADVSALAGLPAAGTGPDVRSSLALNGNNSISGSSDFQLSSARIDPHVDQALASSDENSKVVDADTAPAALTAMTTASSFEATPADVLQAAAPGVTLHFASGGVADEVSPFGFNLVDIQSVAQLNELPDGMKGLVWLNQSDGVTSSFVQEVSKYIGNPNLFGFFLVDEPDPTGKWGTQVDAADLRAESDWIHTNLPGAVTFITMMNMGTSADPDFSDTYNWANTHIDYYGLDPYPVRSGSASVDYDMIDRTVAAALDWGISLSRIVPVYQTFGGGDWQTDTGDSYVMPTAAQMRTMLDHWSALVPNPAFDYAYSWGSQNGDVALEDSPELQGVFKDHNNKTVVSNVLYGDNNANTIAGSSADETIYGYGRNDVLSGMAGDDIIFAGSGDDSLKGGAGNDILYGEDGADTLDGGTGNDQMSGGAGSDRYYVDNAGDLIDESVAGSNGFDIVYSRVSVNLFDAAHFKGGIEAVILTGSGNNFAYGNAGANVLIGNSGNNTLNGFAGADTMRGKAGSDKYYIDNAGDVVDESVAGSGGYDTVFSSVSVNLFDTAHFKGGIEAVVLTGSGNVFAYGNTLNNVLIGNAGNNMLNGFAGNDTINGGLGNDTLTGGADNDIFVFNTALGGGNVDTITDFNVADDTIRLENAIFTGLAAGTLAASAFHIGAAATTAAQHIIYNSATGALSFDDDGSGAHAAVQFAHLSTGLALTNADFVVV